MIYFGDNSMLHDARYQWYYSEAVRIGEITLVTLLVIEKSGKWKNNNCIINSVDYSPKWNLQVHVCNFN